MKPETLIKRYLNYSGTKEEFANEYAARIYKTIDDCGLYPMVKQMIKNEKFKGYWRCVVMNKYTRMVYHNKTCYRQRADALMSIVYRITLGEFGLGEGKNTNGEL